MKKTTLFISALMTCTLLASSGIYTADELNTDYGHIENDFTGMTPEIASAYLSVIDELSGHCTVVSSATGMLTERLNCVCCSGQVRVKMTAGMVCRLMDGIPQRFISIHIRTDRLCARENAIFISEPPAGRLQLSLWRKRMV